MSTTQYTVDQIAEQLIGNATLDKQVVSLKLDQFSINLCSNSTALLDWYRHYFAHVLAPEIIDKADIDIIAIERQPTDLGINFQDWPRGENKKGRKDAYFDLPDARLVQKVRTGMLFLQSQGQLIAAGECLKYKNQVINFINSQYMNYIQNHHGVICHAAGLVIRSNGKEQALGMAGFSGGGKSTLMLHMLGQANSLFLSNDRLFLKRDNHQTLAIGIPKLPRVNPGTIVHNPKLQALISAEQRQELLQLPREQLWELEEKYDVFIDDCYGPGKIQYQANIEHFIVLNWSHDNHDAVTLEAIDLEQRSDLLAAIMKSPGPFYQYENGALYQHDTPLDEQAYLDVFQDINVYEAKGGIDFQALSELCYQQILS